MLNYLEHLSLSFVFRVVVFRTVPARSSRMFRFSSIAFFVVNQHFLSMLKIWSLAGSRCGRCKWCFCVFSLSSLFFLLVWFLLFCFFFCLFIAILFLLLSLSESLNQNLPLLLSPFSLLSFPSSLVFLFLLPLVSSFLHYSPLFSLFCSLPVFANSHTSHRHLLSAHVWCVHRVHSSSKREVLVDPVRLEWTISSSSRFHFPQKETQEQNAGTEKRNPESLSPSRISTNCTQP